MINSYIRIATPGAISCYTPSDTGPLTPQAAPTPPATSNHQSPHSNSHQIGDPGPTFPSSPWAALIEVDESHFTGQSPAPFSVSSTPQPYNHDEYHNHLSLQQHMSGPQKAPPQMYSQHVPYADDSSMYQPLLYSQPPPASPIMQYGNMHNLVGVMDNHYTSQNVFSVAPVIQQSQRESPEVYNQSEFDSQDLVDILGDLKIDNTFSGKLSPMII